MYYKIVKKQEFLLKELLLRCNQGLNAVAQFKGS